MSFDDDVRAAIDRAVTALRGQFDAELQGLTEGINRAALDERTRAATQAAAVAEAAAAELRRDMEAQLRDLETRRAQAEMQFQHAGSQVRDAEKQREQAELQRQHAEAQLKDAESRREQAEFHRQQAETQLRDTDARREQAELQRQHAEAKREHAEAQREHADAQRDHAELQLRQIENQHRQAEAQIGQIRASAQQQIDDVRHSSDAQIAELKRSLVDVRRGAQAEVERAVADAVERTRSDDSQANVAYGARLVDAVRRLDEAQSLGDVLDAVAECAAKEAARVAVLIVKDDRLAGWRFVGFGAQPPEPASTQLDIESAGIAGAVVRTGVSVSRSSNLAGQPHSSHTALPAFAEGTDPSFALALPILVGGSVVAVLYADAPPSEAPPAASRRSVVLEILARHASRALEAMTLRQVIGVSKPRSMAHASPGPTPGATQSGRTDRSVRVIG